MKEGSKGRLHLAEMELQWCGVMGLGLREKSPSSLCHVVHVCHSLPAGTAHLGPTEERAFEGKGLASVTGMVAAGT